MEILDLNESCCGGLCKSEECTCDPKFCDAQTEEE